MSIVFPCEQGKTQSLVVLDRRNQSVRLYMCLPVRHKPYDKFPQPQLTCHITHNLDCQSTYLNPYLYTVRHQRFCILIFERGAMQTPDFLLESEENQRKHPYSVGILRVRNMSNEVSSSNGFTFHGNYFILKTGS